MDRRQLVLASMATQGQAEFSPVQLQKLFFLIDERASKRLGGKKFSFTPYHYGPFDKSVYAELQAASEAGQVAISTTDRWRTFKLTPDGEAEGRRILEGLDEPVVEFLCKTAAFVRGHSFQELVRSIYKAYPEMRAKSVFQD